MPATTSPGLSLAPMRGLRYTVDDAELGARLCPPYDVIDTATRAHLLAIDPDNAVAVVLPVPPDATHAGGAPSADDAADGADAYQLAADRLAGWVADGVVAVDEQPALYVYEMRVPADGDHPETITRGLLGAVELRDPDDRVILPHENTMAGPVADRLALMDATDANLEPIYLVYDGGGAASHAVAAVTDDSGATDDSTATDTATPATAEAGARSKEGPLATATTPDGIVHRLWAIRDAATLHAIAADLETRHALIADGHHRYATYRQLAARRGAERGAGPWDRGLALLVDSSTYGPQVHPIHRVIPGLDFSSAMKAATALFQIETATSVPAALAQLSGADQAGSFAVVVTDGTSAAVVFAPTAAALAAARAPGEPDALMDLDVSVLHRVLIERSWGLVDDEFHVGYAHDVDEAVTAAQSSDGIAVLLRATPVDGVAAVAAAGARMPRKSTFFTPKPASGLVMRRFVDQDPETPG